jgi:TRAP-type C4-dicarboxylate transport system permease small subunit
MFSKLIGYLESCSQLQGKALNLIGVCVIPLIAIDVTADVVGRYFFNHPIPGALDTSELLLVVVVCFALAFTASVGGHMSVDVVTSRLGARMQSLANVLIGLIGLPVLWLLTYFALWEGIHNYSSGLETAVLHIPIYPFKFVVAIGFFALSLELTCQWLRSIERLFGAKGPST